MKTAVCFSLCVMTVVAVLLLKTTVAKEEENEAIGKIEEIKTTLRGLAKRVQEIAKEDDKDVGKILEDQIKAGWKAGVGIFNKAKYAAKSGTLTEEKAKDIFGKLLDGLKSIKKGAKDLIGKLSEVAKNEIEELFNVEYVTVDEMIQELYSKSSDSGSEKTEL